MSYGGVSTVEDGSTSAVFETLKKQVREGSVELSLLGAVGSGAMMVVSVLALVEDLMTIAPVRGLLMIYCFFGGAALLALEGIHRPSALLRAQVLMLRTYLYQEFHVLTTLTGRSFAYAFFGSLLLTEGSWLARIVGLFLVALACAMLYVARRASSALTKMASGLSPSELEARFDARDTDHDGKLDRSELAGLCSDLGTTLTARELESALHLLDNDHSGTIDKKHFLNWWHGDNWQRSLLAAAPGGASSGEQAAESSSFATLSATGGLPDATAIQMT